MRGRCDPLDFIANAVSPQLAAKKIAKAFISDKNHHDLHWSAGAQNYLAAIMIWVKCDRNLDNTDMSRTMETVAQILFDPDIEQLTLEQMVESDIPFVRDQARAFLGRKGKKQDEDEDEDEEEEDD